MSYYADKSQYEVGSSNSSSSSNSNFNSISNRNEGVEVPKVWQGNWYDSRIINPISGYWDEGYDLKVEINGESRYYKVINDKIKVVSELEVFLVKPVSWKDISERVRTQVVMNFFSQISEDQLMKFVYGLRQAEAKKFIKEKDIEWARTHIVHNLSTTRVISKALGYQFSTQKFLRREYGELYKEEYVIDNKWLVTITYESGKRVCQPKISIADYEPIRQERKNFGTKAQHIVRTQNVPWEIARILANIEDEAEITGYSTVFKWLEGMKVPKEIEYSLITGDNRREAIESILGKSFCEKYLKRDSDIKHVADYILGFKR